MLPAPEVATRRLATVDINEYDCMADAAWANLFILSCVCNKSRYIAMFNRFAGMCVGRCKWREFCMDLWFSRFLGGLHLLVWSRDGSAWSAD